MFTNIPRGELRSINPELGEPVPAVTDSEGEPFMSDPFET